MIDSRYLDQRETSQFHEQKAYFTLSSYLETLEHHPRRREREHLKSLHRLFSYCQILKAFENVRDEGSYPKRERVLHPLGYLACGWISKVLERIAVNDARYRRLELQREQARARAEESHLAVSETERLIDLFHAEHPTPTAQAEAILNIQLQHPEKFQFLTLESSPAQRLAIALLCERIEALRAFEGAGQGEGSQKKTIALTG